jgi:choline dehydrogenase-like flavoprotein
MLDYFPLAKSRRDGSPLRLVDTEAIAFADSPHGTLLHGHTVTRLVTLDGRTLDHALVAVGDAPASKVRAKLFILAAGVVESARQLLLSRSSWFPAGLGNGRDLVGRYFNVHPTVRWEFEPPPANRVLPRELYGGPNRTYAYMDDFRRRGFSAAHFQLRTLKDGLVLKLQPEIEPRTENRVTLAKSAKDRAGDPIADLAFSYGARDRRTFEAGQSELAAQVKALGAEGAAIDRSEKWRFHPAGTLRMARDEKNGVVDPHGQLFGIDNLFVAGASTFPTSGTANPTGTIVALAHRLADHLL